MEVDPHSGGGGLSRNLPFHRTQNKKKSLGDRKKGKREEKHNRIKDDSGEDAKKCNLRLVEEGGYRPGLTKNKNT